MRELPVILLFPAQKCSSCAYFSTSSSLLHSPVMVWWLTPILTHCIAAFSGGSSIFGKGLSFCQWERQRFCVYILAVSGRSLILFCQLQWVSYQSPRFLTMLQYRIVPSSLGLAWLVHLLVEVPRASHRSTVSSRE